MKNALFAVRLLTIFAFLFSGQTFAQPCSVAITGDALVCSGDQTTLTAVANGPDVQLMASNTAGNNHRGNMFDITATNSVTILSFDASPMANTTVEIYYKVGTWNGFANTPSAWTFVGSAPVAFTGGFAVVPVNVNVTIPAGQTYAFYVTSNNTSVSLNYSNGTAVGNVYSSDANITFLEGGGLEYPFTQGTGAVYQPRVWNGNIHYAVNGQPTTYLWGGGETTASIQPTVMSNTQYTVQSSVSGCPTASAALDVVVSVPTVDAGSDETICMGDTILLHATGNAANYSWDNPITDSVSFVPSATMSYTVTAIDSIGCINTDDVEITVNALPSVTAGSDFSVCSGDTTILNGQGAMVYMWNNGISNNSPFVPIATNQYVVTGVDINGCSNSDTVEVTVNTLPNVSAGLDQDVCFNETMTLSGSGADSYVWDSGIPDGSPFMPNPGTSNYVVIGTDLNGCSAADTVSITSHDWQASVMINGTTIGANFMPTASYQWYNCDLNQIIAGETTMNYTPTVTGNYAVIMTDGQYGCVDTSNCVLIDFTGIQEATVGAFNVFPNPTKGSITVNSVSTTIDKVEVMDMLGSLLFTEEIGLLNTTIDLSSYEGKQFLIRVFSNEKVEVIKVLKF